MPSTSGNVPLTWTSSSVVARDSLLERAARAIDAQRPTLASRMLAPRLADSAGRTPATVLLAAEAAAAWNGWLEVERLLTGERWLDSMANGRARELLARAALERTPRATRTDSMALLNAERAVKLAADDGTRGVRLVLLARAQDRLDLLDRAATSYREAGKHLDLVADWLHLRAAAVSMHEGDRARLLAQVRSPLARSRRLWAEADARSRSGDIEGASATLQLAGDTIASMRLRLPTTTMPEVERAQLRAWLTQRLTTDPGTATARDAAELLLQHFAPLTSGEHLAIARSDAVTGAVDRAIRSFNAAFAMSAGTMQDRFALASMLSRAGRDREAAQQFARVSSPRSLAASAEYQRARSLLRSGQGTAAERLLRDISTRYADLEDGSAQALYLLGDLASDARRDAVARQHWRELAQRYPTHALSQTARFRAALMSYVAGDFRTAASEWDAIAAQFPDGSESNASRYWAGRALHRLGQATDASKRWRDVAEREPRSYYAMLSAQRLGERPFAPQIGGPTGDDWRGDARLVERVAEDAHDQLRRAALLERLGLTPEAAIERDALYRDASATGVTTPRVTAASTEPTGAQGTIVRTDSLAARALAAAYAFSRAGFPSRGILLVERARALGMQLEGEDWRLLYPMTHAQVIAAESKRNRIDAALVAAIIRQESRYTPTALSGAGARGLMQIMPAVGRSLAHARGIVPWDDVMLYQPDVSIELGTTHLAAELRRDGNPTHALAAYNAGRSRLTRWRNLRGSDDPELFIERIPYVETRDYVRIVLRNQEFYRALYTLDNNASRRVETSTQLE
jgi:soluble lytic murein transglycosylase